MSLVIPSPGPFKRWTHFNRNHLQVTAQAQIGVLQQHPDPEVPSWGIFLPSGEWGTLLYQLQTQNNIPSIMAYTQDERVVEILFPYNLVVKATDGRADRNFQCFEINGCRLGLKSGTWNEFPLTWGPLYCHVVIASFTPAFFALLPFTYENNDERIDILGKTSGTRLSHSLGSPDGQRLVIFTSGGKLPIHGEEFRVMVYNKLTLVQREILPP